MTTRLVAELPLLYSLSSKGKVKQWGIKVYEREGEYHWISSHGYVGAKIVDEMSSAIKGKNIGKKNETSPEEQAISDASSKWRGKIDKNYSEQAPTSIADFTNIRPMLAHKWTERKHNISFPCYVQPKFNGVRCLAIPEPNDEFKFMSRGGKEYTTLRHIEETLAAISGVIPGTPLDGEIFNPDMSFQDITRAVKKLRETTEQLQYWIYDVADTTKTFEERLAILEEIADEIPKNDCIVIAPTFLVENEEELMEYHRKFSLDYEGTMIRNIHGMYVYDFRSTDLQKMKDFIDAEFPIVGAKAGTGSDAGTVIFRCSTPDGKEFDVRPRGDRQYRRELLEDIKNILAQKLQLTVRYQELSEDGIPIFPVGIVVRDYE